jgi:MFS family permease
MLITFIVWTILSQRFGVTKGSSLGRGVLALIFIFTMFYTVGISALAYAYPIEIFPYTLRSRGLSFSVCVNMCGLIVGLFVHPIALTEIGWKYYIVFCVILTTMFLVVYFFYPETKGRTLEEIAEIFDGEPVSGETSSSEARVQEEKNRRTVSIEQAG